MSSILELRIRFPIDDGVLSELHARAFSHPRPPPPVTVQPWRHRLECYSVTWVGAFADKALVGFVHACWDGGNHAFLLDAIVAPQHRRRGLGRQLVRVLIEEVKEAGCEWLHVDFEPELAAFYQRVGFDSTSAGLLRLTP